MDSPFWRPKSGLVYRPWSKGGEHTGKSASVKIHAAGKSFDGTFSVGKDGCTIHIWRGGRKPVEVFLSKGAFKIRKTTHQTVGEQPILYWKSITYDVFVNSSTAITLP